MIIISNRKYHDTILESTTIAEIDVRAQLHIIIFFLFYDVIMIVLLYTAILFVRTTIQYCNSTAGVSDGFDGWDIIVNHWSSV